MTLGIILLVLLALIIGIIIGWHLPQPSWAKKLETDVEQGAMKVLGNKRSDQGRP